jgi:DNA polymerase elongation subunit (family B)
MNEVIVAHRRVLDFDMETRPLAVWYDGKCTWEPTAIAWAWDDGRISTLALPEVSRVKMLLTFRAVIDIAVLRGDVLTGHNIDQFDLPVLSAAMAENDLPPLEPVLTQDTLRGLPKMKDLSRSQENLGIMFGLRAPKVHMSNADWREANRMSEGGVAKTKRRVAGDVRQHRELRRELLRRGLLKPPKLWRP